MKLDVLMNRRSKKLLLIGVIISLLLAVLQFRASYNLATTYLALSQEDPSRAYVSDETWYVPVARNILSKIFGVNITDWPYPREPNIENFLNTEHPPLGKYIISLSMITCGDKPLCWRLPSITEAALLVIIVFFIGWRLGGFIGGVSASLLAYLDPMTTNLGSVAMLDIHLTFFSALTLLFLIYDRPFPALLTTGLALSVKYSGALLIPVHYVYFRVRGKSPLYSIIVSLFIPTTILVINNLPFILTDNRGFAWWLNEVLSSLSWFTTTKEGPPKSAPWDWLFNRNYFVLTYEPKTVAAKGLYPLYLLAFILALLVLPCSYVKKEYREKRLQGIIPLVYFVSILIGYTVIFIKGNRSLYSFYAVQLAPAASLIIPVTISTLDNKVLTCSIEAYRNLAKVITGLKKLENLPREISWIPRLWRPGYTGFTHALFSLVLLVLLISTTGNELLTKFSFIYRSEPDKFVGAHTGIGTVITKILSDYITDEKIYLISYVMVILFSVVVINKELYFLGRRILPQAVTMMPVLSLAVYTLLPGYSITQALLILGISLLFTGNSLLGSFLLGLAINNYQYIAGLIVLILLVNKCLIAPFMAGLAISLGVQHYIYNNTSLSTLIFSGLVLEPGVTSSGSLMYILAVLSIVIALAVYIFLMKGRASVNSFANDPLAKLTIASIFIIMPRIFFPYSSTIQLVFVLPLLYFIVPRKDYVFLLDAFLALTVFLYTGIAVPISKILFKYTPHGISDIYHPANLVHVLISALVFCLIVQVIHTYRERKKYPEEVAESYEELLGGVRSKE